MFLGGKNKEIARTYQNIGGLMEATSKLDSALEFYTKSLCI